MRYIILTLTFLISFNSFSQEKFFCSASLEIYNRPDEVQVTIYERMPNRIFKRTNTKTGEVDYFNVLKENDEFICLTETYEYPSLFIVFINKNDKTFYEKYIWSDDKKYDTGLPLRGTFVKM
tara:strand:+ start:639 stop:1004 length:366 start_codon:yes stop_codon:yes gene_type:complete